MAISCSRGSSQARRGYLPLRHLRSDKVIPVLNRGPHLQCRQGNICSACVEHCAHSRSLKTLATDRYREGSPGKKESKPTTCAGVCKSATESTPDVLLKCPFWGDLPFPFMVNRVLPSVRGFPESREAGSSMSVSQEHLVLIIIVLIKLLQLIYMFVSSAGIFSNNGVFYSSLHCQYFGQCLGDRRIQ